MVAGSLKLLFPPEPTATTITHIRFRFGKPVITRLVEVHTSYSWYPDVPACGGGGVMALGKLISAGEPGVGIVGGLSLIHI